MVREKRIKIKRVKLFDIKKLMSNYDYSSEEYILKKIQKYGTCEISTNGLNIHLQNPILFEISNKKVIDNFVYCDVLLLTDVIKELYLSGCKVKFGYQIYGFENYISTINVNIKTIKI